MRIFCLVTAGAFGLFVFSFFANFPEIFAVRTVSAMVAILGVILIWYLHGAEQAKLRSIRFFSVLLPKDIEHAVQGHKECEETYARIFLEMYDAFRGRDNARMLETTRAMVLFLATPRDSPWERSQWGFEAIEIWTKWAKKGQDVTFLHPMIRSEMGMSEVEDDR